MSDLVTQFAELGDQIGIPVFVLRVEPDGTIRFEKLNPTHERLTGLVSKEVSGKTPHEAFPPRLADTVLQNYRRCAERKVPYIYEEVLWFPAGEKWWQTALSPVIESDSVIGIVGIAQDITEHKRIGTRLADALRELNRVSTELQVLSTTAAHDLLAPLRQIRQINESILEGFRDLGDNKLDLVRTSNTIIDKALDKLDSNLANVKQAEQAASSVSRVDTGHFFSDILAVLDPQRKLNCTFPKRILLAESITLDLVCRNLLDIAIANAKKEIAIDLVASGEEIVITISNDGTGYDPELVPIGDTPNQAAEGSPELAAAIQLVEARGGRIWLGKPKFATGNTISFSVNGHAVEE